MARKKTTVKKKVIDITPSEERGLMPSGGLSQQGDVGVQNVDTVIELTPAIVKSLYEQNPDTEAFNTAEQTKLAGIEPNATADQTGAEIVSAIDAQLGNTDWQTPGAGATDLTYNAGTIESSTGTNATIPDATAATKGLATAAQITKLDGIETAATADQTPAEIVAAVDTALGNTDWQSGGGVSGGDFSLASGTVVIEGEYIGSIAPTVTNPAAGEYTVTVPAGTRIISLNVFGNNTTLNGSNEFILRVDHSADTVNRRYTVQQYNGTTGARSDVFSIGTNETQNITANVTQITFPGMNGYGSGGFDIALA